MAEHMDVAMMNPAVADTQVQNDMSFNVPPLVASTMGNPAGPLPNVLSQTVDPKLAQDLCGPQTQGSMPKLERYPGNT